MYEKEIDLIADFLEHTRNDPYTETDILEILAADKAGTNAYWKNRASMLLQKLLCGHKPCKEVGGDSPYRGGR